MSDQNPLTNEQIKQELLKQRKTIKALEERWPKFIQNTDEVLHGYKVKLDEHEKEINAYKLQPQGADTEKSTLTDTERLLVQDVRKLWAASHNLEKINKKLEVCHKHSDPTCLCHFHKKRMNGKITY